MDFSRATAHAMSSLGAFVPELLLVGAILLTMLADLLAGRGKPLDGSTPAGRLPGWIAFAGLLATAVAAWGQLGMAPRTVFFGMLTVDSLAAFFKLLFAVSTALIVLVSFRIKPQGELHALLLTVVLGMSLLAGSRHLLMAAVALEMIGVMSYVLAGFDRRDPRASEAALKYMIFGSMATGALLYGGSLLYGLTGSLDFAGMQWGLGQSGADGLILLLALLLVLAGIGYKVAMAPFHYWCPDVYDGAPTPITTFFSVGPKAAGLALLIRFLYPHIGSGELSASVPARGFEPLFVIAVLAAFTMTLGNLAAIGQTRIKRLLAYSSIAHAGYLMTGLVIADSHGLEAVLLYLVLSMTMFPAISILSGLYTIVREFGVYGTPLALVITYPIFTLPFTVWVLTSFFRGLPREIEQAAIVDGANYLQIFWHILLPLTAPALVTTGLLSFVSSWNEYLFALNFTLTNPDAQTVTVAIAKFTGFEAYQDPIAEIMAAATRRWPPSAGGAGAGRRWRWR